MWRSLLSKPTEMQHDGVQMGAVLAFTNAILRACDVHRIDRGAVVFDGPGRSFRSLLTDRYKASREHQMPDGGEEQIPLMRKMAQALGLSVFDSAPYEADDILASLARRYAQDEVVVFSDDKDLGALVRERRVMQQRPRDANVADSLIDERAVRAQWHVSPRRVPDVQALCGDSVDEVKGVPNVGGVGARRYIRRHGSFERFALAAADGQGARWIQRASAMADARRMIAATRMLTDVVVPEIVPRRIDWPRDAVALLLEIGAEATAGRLARRYGIAIRGREATRAHRRSSLFGRG